MPNRYKWFTCPKCGCDHCLLPHEREQGAGGPFCSRCRLHGRTVALVRPKAVPIEIRRKGKAMDESELRRAGR